MAKAQEEIANLEVEGSSGGGMVQVKINGDHRIIELNIEPEAVDPDDVDMLEDMVIAAINDAMNKLDKASEERMGSVTGGLPGMPGMGF